MSLRWNVSDCENYEALFRVTTPPHNPDREVLELRPVPDALVFMTMTVGIGKITEENYEEFYLRMKFAEEVGTLSQSIVEPGNDEDGNLIRRNPTLGEIKRCIGLSTNAAKKSRSKFIKNALENRDSDIESIEEQKSEWLQEADRADPDWEVDPKYEELSDN